MHEAIGSVRVDLLGGTIDLSPINLILPKVVTLNLATSLRAKVRLEDIDFPGVEIHSEDYQTTKRYLEADITDEKIQQGFFEKFQFIIEILRLFKATSHIKVQLASGSPAGAGLGGSSAMGVTLYKALCFKYKQKLEREEAIKQVMGIESRILDSGPAGYQDYYPALFGGVLALHPTLKGVQVEQLYTEELKAFLESNLTLVYSGEARHSGMNNWEVYKGFFDKNPSIRKGLESIASLSHEAYLAINQQHFNKLAQLIAREGEERAGLFPGLVSPSMKALEQALKNQFPKEAIGLKVCGAGGGGCFLLVHSPKLSNEVESVINKHGMQKLPLLVEPPLQHFSSSSDNKSSTDKSMPNGPSKSKLSFLSL